MATIALSRGVNANLLRRWVREAEGCLPSLVRPAALASPTFVPLQLPALVLGASNIHVELERAGTIVTIKWPTSAAAECAAWLRELLR